MACCDTTLLLAPVGIELYVVGDGQGGCVIDMMAVGNVAGIAWWIPIPDTRAFLVYNTGRICNDPWMVRGTTRRLLAMPTTCDCHCLCILPLCTGAARGGTDSNPMGH